MNNDLTRDSFDSGSETEAKASYSRAVRIGDWILVSGTAAIGPDGVVGTDATAQTEFIIDKIEHAIRTLGGRLEDVVRTRIFIRDLSDVDAVARVHGTRFAAIRPANTLVQASPAGDGLLVEIEADAFIGAGNAIRAHNKAPPR